MSTTQIDIGEHDVVALLTPVGGWPTGTEGTVISDGPVYKLIEISNDLGEEIDSVDAQARQLRLVWKCPPPSS